LGALAAEKAIQRAGIDKDDIDLVICATLSPDYLCMPSTACLISDKIGIRNAMAFDVSAACSGFVYMLSIAKAFIESGAKKNILLVGAEKISSIVDYTDRGTCILFGDGAGAVLLERDEREGILSFDIGADGSYGDLLYVESVGSDVDPPYYVKMKGNEVFKVAVRTMVESAQRVMEKSGLTPSDIDLLVPHQANVRILKAVAERLGMEMDKLYINLPKYGNTSAASIPLALDEAVRSGRAKQGDVILMVAFGGGFTWGSCIVKL
jgi:3-oxoacyl-[acyl-carrier-protein] synthase-3